jgi:hypothetical protein
MIGVIPVAAAADADEHVAEILAATAAAGAGPTTLADLVDAAGAIVDGGLDVAVSSCVAEADDHGVNLKLAFKGPQVNGN